MIPTTGSVMTEQPLFQDFITREELGFWNWRRKRAFWIGHNIIVVLAILVPDHWFHLGSTTFEGGGFSIVCADAYGPDWSWFWIRAGIVAVATTALVISLRSHDIPSLL